MSNINIYCDESCYLQHDGIDFMVLGAVWCPCEKVKEINKNIRQIKINNRLSPKFEVKWNKVSKGKEEFYLNLLHYFFNNSDLHFRAIVVKEKSKLNHEQFKQSHDEWYYKMYFNLLKVIIDPRYHYNIYLDIKDTRGAYRIKKLREILCNNSYDFSRSIIEKIQLIRSNEVEIVQITDLLIGIVSYANRDLNTNSAKKTLVDKMKLFSNYSLKNTTLYRENKTNIFIWKPINYNNEN